jgi:predicted amidohydrolase
VVAVAQPPCAPYDVAGNAAAHAAVIRSAGARLVVFPEMSLTGYHFDAPPIAVDDRRLTPIVDACAQVGAVALVGVPVEGAAGRPHIALVAVDGDGAAVAYRKMCLAGAEPDHFAAGAEPAVVEVDGWRLGLAICKDTGVPEHAARTIGQGADVYVAGVLERADTAQVMDERAQRIARDHQVWVAVASFAGSTGEGYDHAAGRSGFWRPGGVVHAQAGPEVGTITQATLAPSEPRN